MDINGPKSPFVSESPAISGDRWNKVSAKKFHDGK